MHDYKNTVAALMYCGSPVMSEYCGSCPWLNECKEGTKNPLHEAAESIKELLAVVNHLESCIDQALDALDRGADNDRAREALEKATQFPEPPKEVE